MNKKNRIVKGIAFLVFIILLLWWYGYIPNGAPDKYSPPTVSVSTPSTNTTSSHPVSPVPDHPTPEEMQKSNEAQVRYQSHVFQLLLLTPIVFYGKVVDTDGNPITGAKADISAADHIGEGDSMYERTTDSNGLFSIWTHGMGLVINVSKDGYYTLKESAGNFDYAYVGHATNPHTNSKDPAIFVLRKRGDAEPMIMFQEYVKTPRNGNPSQVNLTTGGSGVYEHHGDIQVEAWTHDKDDPSRGNGRYDWKCQITVLGGGLQPRTGGEFDFIAPTDGYQPSDEIDMPADAAQWSRSASRSYFLKLANGTYARIDFTMRAEVDHFFDITSYLNPAVGHRNLEFDPDKQINKK